MNKVCVSIVSHGHGGMVADLVRDLCRCPQVSRILLTQNIPEPGPKRIPVKVIVSTNRYPSGYAANHNMAFRSCRTPFFCVLNPDIRFQKNPFPALLSAMKDPRVAICAPSILTPNGKKEDSHRLFPSLGSLLVKALGGYDGKVPAGQERAWDRGSWLAGMFLFLRADAFRRVGGFDEKFFLYYEDVDLCARLITVGGRVSKVAEARVIHHARRESRKNLRFARWHSQSMARYFWKRWMGVYGKFPVSSVKLSAR